MNPKILKLEEEMDAIENNIDDLNIKFHRLKYDRGLLFKEHLKETGILKEFDWEISKHRQVLYSEEGPLDELLRILKPSIDIYGEDFDRGTIPFSTLPNTDCGFYDAIEIGLQHDSNDIIQISYGFTVWVQDIIDYFDLTISTANLQDRILELGMQMKNLEVLVEKYKK